MGSGEKMPRERGSVEGEFPIAENPRTDPSAETAQTSSSRHIPTGCDWLSASVQTKQHDRLLLKMTEM
jgi:hypothetical protein